MKERLNACFFIPLQANKELRKMESTNKRLTSQLSFVTIQVWWWFFMLFYFHDYLDQQSLSSVAHALDTANSRFTSYLTAICLFCLIGILGQSIGMYIHKNHLRRIDEEFCKKMSFGLTLTFTLLFILPDPNNISIVYILGFFRALVAVPFQLMIIRALKQHRFAFLVSVVMGFILVGLSILVFLHFTKREEGQSWLIMQGIKWSSSAIPCAFLLLVAYFGQMFAHSL